MKRNRELQSQVGSASDEPMCPLCDSRSIETTLHVDEFDYGNGDSAVTLKAEVPVRYCSKCDLEYLDEVGEQLQHAAICKHLGVLSPSEVCEVRNRYGMTRAEFAEATGLGEATLARWERGGLVQNRANDIYLRLVRTPGVMRILQTLLAARSVPAAETDVSPGKFRKLNVSKRLLQEQEAFDLPREQILLAA